MKFEDALKELKKGKKIRRANWSNQSKYRVLIDNHIKNQDGMSKSFSGEQMLSNDWEIFEEKDTPVTTFDIKLTPINKKDNNLIFQAEAHCKEFNWYIWEEDECLEEAIKKLSKEIRRKINDRS